MEIADDVIALLDQVEILQEAVKSLKMNVSDLKLAGPTGPVTMIPPYETLAGEKPMSTQINEHDLFLDSLFPSLDNLFATNQNKDDQKSIISADRLKTDTTSQSTQTNEQDAIQEPLFPGLESRLIAIGAETANRIELEVTRTLNDLCESYATDLARARQPTAPSPPPPPPASVSGGATLVITLLLVAVGYLVWERKNTTDLNLEQARAQLTGVRQFANWVKARPTGEKLYRRYLRDHPDENLPEHYRTDLSIHARSHDALDHLKPYSPLANP